MEAISFLKKRWKFIAVFAAVSIFAVCGIAYFSRQSLSVSLNTENLSYVICYTRGLGPRKLEYSEHEVLLGGLINMVSGEYSYVGSWSNAGMDGGGPYSIFLYDDSGELIDTIHYMNGRIYVPASGNGKYYIYKNKNVVMDFAALENCLDLYGE